jgi:hypothetical protein
MAFVVPGLGFGALKSFPYRLEGFPVEAPFVK